MRGEEIDWAGLRAAAVAIGIRPAARQAARDLPPDEQERFVQRAMKRCSRQKWLAKAQQDKADAVVTSPSALSANVRKGSDVLAHALAETTRETRHALARAALRSARKVKEVPIKSAKDLRDAAATAHMLGPAWEQRDTRVGIQVNVLSGNFEETHGGPC